MPWDCTWDFNSILFSHEKKREQASEFRDMQQFQEAINVPRLRYTSFKQYKQAWTNGTKGADNVQEQFDRVLVYEEWLQLYQNIKVHYLA